MGSRTLVWTGDAGTTDFATAANWSDAGSGTPAKYAPVRDDTVELLGAGTITGSGTVAVFDVADNAGTPFQVYSAALQATTITDSGWLNLSESNLIGRYLAVEGSAAGSAGILNASGSKIIVSEFSIGAANGGTADIFDSILTLGEVGGVALAVASTHSSGTGYSSGTFTLDTCQVTITGGVEIGAVGGGTVYVQGTNLTTRGDVVMGGPTGSGTLVVEGAGDGAGNGGTWTETGSVKVGIGSLIQFDASPTGDSGQASISGNLSITGGQVDMNGAYVLTIGGNLVLGGAAGGSFTPAFQTMYGGVVSANNIELNGFSFLNLGSSQNSTVTNLSVAGRLDVGSSATVKMSFAIGDIGTKASDMAASVSGTWLQMAGAANFTGALSLEGGSLTLSDSGTISVTASGLAIVAHNARISIDAEAHDLLSATGGMGLLNGSTLTANGGTVTAVSAPGHEALLVDTTSTLASFGTVLLGGNATINGQFYASDIVFGAGTLTVGADGSVTAAGSVSDAVYDAGTISTASGYDGGTLTFAGPISGSGTLSLAPGGGTLALLGAVSKTITADFATTGTITLGDAAGFHGEIAGWASGDTLDLLNLAATSDSVSGQSLTLYGSTHDKLAVLQFTQPITSGEFSLAQGPNGSTILTHT
jgi:hypothetical protein